MIYLINTRTSFIHVDNLPRPVPALRRGILTHRRRARPIHRVHQRHCDGPLRRRNRGRSRYVQESRYWPTGRSRHHLQRSLHASRFTRRLLRCLHFQSRLQDHGARRRVPSHRPDRGPEHYPAIGRHGAIGARGSFRRFSCRTTPKVKNSVDSRQMADLPLNGRNAFDLAVLSPGATTTDASTTPGQQDNVGLTVNGFLATQNNWQLDGGTYNNLHFGSARTLPIPDTLQELRPSSRRISARTIAAAALSCELITRSGSRMYSTAPRSSSSATPNSMRATSSPSRESLQAEPIRRYRGRSHQKGQTLFLWLLPGHQRARQSEPGTRHRSHRRAARR